MYVPGLYAVRRRAGRADVDRSAVVLPRPPSAALEDRIRTAVVERINASLRPDERIEPQRLTVAHLKTYVRLVKESDKTAPLVASRSRPGLIADIAAYMDGTLSKRQRKTTRKRRARDDVHVNYETLQQLMELIRDAWALALPDVVAVARHSLGGRAADWTDAAVITQVGADCNEFRYVCNVAQSVTFWTNTEPRSVWCYGAATFMIDSCGIAKPCSRASWTRLHRGAESKI